MNDIFPEPIRNLPEAVMPLKGVKAYLSQGQRHQVIFMQFDCDEEMGEHSHAAQVGFVLAGRIDLVVEGEIHSYTKGDRYYIPEGVKHSGKIHAGFAQVVFFNDPDRYKTGI